MLRLVLHLLSLLGAPLLGLAADAPGPGPAAVAVSEPPAVAALARVSIDASFLPAATGWFLVPVTLAKDAFVDVDVRYAAGPGTTAAVVLGRAEGARVLGAHGWTANVAEASREDASVGCCADLAPPAGGGRDGKAAMQFFRGGETVWVGLAAVGWGSDAAMRVNLTAAEAVLQVGPARKGTTVEALDLAEAARRNGTNVRALGATLAGHAGNATRRWEPQGTGLLMLDARGAGNGTARLHVALPSGTLFEEFALTDAGVQVAALQSGGAFEVRLRGVKDAGARSVLPVEELEESLHARVLYADLDAPMDGLAFRVERGRPQ